MDDTYYDYEPSHQGDQGCYDCKAKENRAINDFEENSRLQAMVYLLITILGKMKLQIILMEQVERIKNMNIQGMFGKKILTFVYKIA